MFVGTLQAPYYKKLVGNAITNFIDMVISSEMIENAIKSDRISITEAPGSIKKIINKGKEREVNIVGETNARFNQSLHPAKPMYFPNMLNMSLTPHLSTPQPVHTIGFAFTMSFAPNPM